MPTKILGSDYEDVTGADITNLSLQNQGHHEIELFPTTDAIAPSNVAEGYILVPSSKSSAKTAVSTLEQLFPSVEAPVRVWARSANGKEAKIWYSFS